MTLTFPGAPLASEPPITTNYAIDGPRHRLLLHPFPRRVRARFAGEVVLDSTRGAPAAREQHPAAALRPARGRPRRPARAHRPHARTARSRATRRTGRSASATAWPRTRCGPTRARSPRRRGCWAWSASTPSAWTPGSTRTRRSPACATPTTASDARRSSRRDRGPRRRRGPGAQRAPGRRGRDRLAAALLPPARGRLRRAAPERHDRDVPVQGPRRRTGRSTASRTSPGPTRSRWRASLPRATWCASTRARSRSASWRSTDCRTRSRARASAGGASRGAPTYTVKTAPSRATSTGPPKACSASRAPSRRRARRRCG